jgi:hypothetical protein
MLDGDKAFMFAFRIFFRVNLRCRMHVIKNVATNCVNELGSDLNDLLCQELNAALAAPQSEIMQKRLDKALLDFAEFPTAIEYLTGTVFPLLPQIATSLIREYTHELYNNQLVESYNRGAKDELGLNRCLRFPEIVRRLLKLDSEYDSRVWC